MLHFRVADVCGGARAQSQCKPGAKPVIVTIIDSCPGCSFNIPVPLFSTLADPVVGVLPVAYEQARPRTAPLCSAGRVRLPARPLPCRCTSAEDAQAGVHAWCTSVVTQACIVLSCSLTWGGAGAQVNCNWAGPITIRVLEYLTVNASYIKLIMFNVAGPATIRAVAVKSSTASVRDAQD
jgi:hypothetical protein